MAATTSAIEARVKRVLELRVDSALVAHLDTLASVFAESDAPGGAITLPGAAGLRADIDGRSLQVAQAFLARLAPIDAQLHALAGAVDAGAAACAAALARAEQNERVSAAFLAAAADTARRRAAVQAEVARLRALAAEYTLRPEDSAALAEGPDGGSEFFDALARVGAIRERALNMVAGGGGSSGDDTVGAGGGSGEHALGLELLEGAMLAQSSTLDNLFEWALTRCRNAEAVFSVTSTDGDEGGEAEEAEAAVQRERIAVLGSAAVSSPDRNLRKALAILATLRPAYCRSCQEAAVGARRGAFVRAFVRALSAGGGGGGFGGGGAGGADSGGRPIDANAHDAVRYVSDLCAWAHLHAAEEAEAFGSVFKGADAQVGASGSGGGEEGAAAAAAAAALAGAGLGDSSRLQTTREMVTAVCDGLARPLTIRIEQVITSGSATLPVACRLVDVLAFYVRTLAGILAQGSDLLAGLRSVQERCIFRVEELLQLQAGRIREAAPAYPSTLSVTPLVADVVALLEDLLRAHGASLLSAPATSAAASAAADGTTLLSSGTVDIARVLDTLVAPTLESARASASGLRVLDTATFLCNQVSSMQLALSPYASASRLVQRLAAELSGYEESMVQTLSEEVLSEAGLLSKLAAIRSHAASQGNASRLADLSGVRPAELRAAVSAFVSELNAPGGGPLSTFDRIDNPRLRSRLRRDAAAVLFEAFCRVSDAVSDPSNGYTQAPGEAPLLPPKSHVQVLLDLT